jgi:hypothetical protein
VLTFVYYTSLEEWAADADRALPVYVIPSQNSGQTLAHAPAGEGLPLHCVQGEL